MRRRPVEIDEVSDTHVFSASAWGNADTSYSTTDSSSDLSRYAAPSIPEGNVRSARSARHSPSPHSSYYEPSAPVTNSQSDPFTHASYDGRPAAPAPQNARFDEMPSSVRHTRLGETMPSIAPEHIAPVSAYAQTLQAPSVAPIQSAPQTIQQPLVETPANVLQKEVITPHAYEPIADYSAPSTTDAISEPIDIIEEEIALSDFEEEFILTQSVATETQDIEIDMTQDRPSQPSSWVAPNLVTSKSIAPASAISYNTNDNLFGSQYGNISDEDRLYKDPREPRETIQIDLDFIIGLFRKITINKIIIVVLALVLATAAYFVMKAAAPEPKNLPVNESTQKEIIDSNPIEPTVSIAPAIPQDPNAGPIVQYDENGNPIYSGSTNQNFNGE